MRLPKPANEHKVWRTRLDNEDSSTDLNSVARSRGPLLAVRVWSVGEEALQELIATRADEIQQILHE